MAATAPGYAIPTLIGLVGLGLVARRRLPQLVVGLSFVLAISLASSLELIQRWPTSAGIAQDIARTCGILSFVWSVCASAMVLRGRRQRPRDDALKGFAFLTYVVSLLLGVVVVVIQSIVLMIRIIYVAIDLMNGYPFSGVREYGFGDAGLWSLAFVGVAGTISLLSTGDRRLGASLFWVLAVLGTWASLLAPVLRPTPSGGFVRTQATAVWLIVLAVLVMVSVCVSGWVDRKPLRDLMSSPLRDDAEIANATPGWGGLALSITLVSLFILLSSCYHLLVPVEFDLTGPLLGGLIVAVSTAFCALSCLVMFRRTGQVYAAEAAMGLATFAVCSLAALSVCGGDLPAADRYPLLFTAVIVGFAASTALWVQLASVGRRHRDSGRIETVAARLFPQFTRFAFLSGALGLLASSVLAIWPRLPTIATMDDTLGRVTAGFAANLLLLLTALWSARRLRRPTFHMLAILTVLSCGAFILARILPLTAKYG
ncbi:MAG: hypothetical protein IH989_07065 [Planctomycetes bacterium]|nr:hypothetical protein [Planctomycetota bacterium]